MDGRWGGRSTTECGDNHPVRGMETTDGRWGVSSGEQIGFGDSVSPMVGPTGGPNRSKKRE